MEWIGVKDRLPDGGDYVDIYSKYFGRKLGVEFESIDSFYDNNIDVSYTDVTHWMIPPEPPTRSKENNVKKVYISGAITGNPNYREAFNNAVIYLAKEGYAPVDPCVLNHNHDLSYESYMKEDLKALLECDYIYMLEGWRDSRGACFELETAKISGIPQIKHRGE